MVYVYLSDESITVAKSNEAPRVGEHLGPWLPVIQEIARFRTVTEHNQIALPVAITDVLSLGAVLAHTKENTPATPQTHRILCSVVDQLDTAIVVAVPVPLPPDEEETFEVEMDLAEAERRIVSELIHSDEGDRELITLTADDVEEVKLTTLFDEEDE